MRPSWKGDLDVLVVLRAPDGRHDGRHRGDTGRQHVAADQLVDQRALAAFGLAGYQHPQVAGIYTLPECGQALAVVLCCQVVQDAEHVIQEIDTRLGHVGSLPPSVGTVGGFSASNGGPLRRIPAYGGAWMLSCESRAALCKLRRVAPAVGLAVPKPSLRLGVTNSPCLKTSRCPLACGPVQVGRSRRCPRSSP